MSKTKIAPHGAPLAVSVKEAARLVSVGRSTLYTEIAAGRLKVMKVGRRTLVRVAELDQWLSAYCNGPVAVHPANDGGRS